MDAIGRNRALEVDEIQEHFDAGQLGRGIDNLGGVPEIIGTWFTGNADIDGIWYWDFVTENWTRVTPEAGAIDIAAGDFNGDGKADVASSWEDFGLYYQDGATLASIKIDDLPPNNLTAGDVTGQ